MLYTVNITWPLSASPNLNWELPPLGEYDHSAVLQNTVNDFSGATNISGSLANGVASYTDDSATPDGTPFFYWVVLYNASDEPINDASMGFGVACQLLGASNSGPVWDGGPVQFDVTSFPFYNQPFFPGSPQSVFSSSMSCSYTGNPGDVSGTPPYYMAASLQYLTLGGDALTLQFAGDPDGPAFPIDGCNPVSWEVGGSAECSPDDGATSLPAGTGEIFALVYSGGFTASSPQSATVSFDLSMGTPGGYMFSPPPPPPPPPPSPGANTPLQPPLPTPLPCIPCCITQVPLITQTGEYLLNTAKTP